MKVPNFRPPVAGDFPDLDEQTIAALKVVSDQLRVVTRCLQANVSPEDNGNAVVKEVFLQSGAIQEVEIKGIRGKPVEVVLMDQEKFDFTKLAWEVVDQDHLNVKVTWEGEGNQEDFISTKLLVRGPHV